MKDKLEQIRAAAVAALDEPGADLEAIRIRFLGKKGELTGVLRGMGQLSAEERPIIGQLANDVRAFIENAIAEKAAAAEKEALIAKLKEERLDVTMPGKKPAIGKRHPLATVQKEMEDIFIGMGFGIVDGPEVEYDYYNFQALNIPENHPARDTQDTFYITEN
ncbi:MAG: phenylalanine--tRNA ligase subunit alpha, partial [Clostridia bacterium]|nr:phenylalanine--tRNA ligase subunit alpha [Clostridia bacterium]